MEDTRISEYIAKKVINYDDKNKPSGKPSKIKGGYLMLWHVKERTSITEKTGDGRGDILSAGGSMGNPSSALSMARITAKSNETLSC